MGFLQRLLFLIGTVIAIGVALWLSITLLAVLLVAGGIAVLYFASRRFLVAKGILNPTPGVPVDADIPQTTIIDGEFEQIENPMLKEEER